MNCYRASLLALGILYGTSFGKIALHSIARDEFSHRHTLVTCHWWRNEQKLTARNGMSRCPFRFLVRTELFFGISYTTKNLENDITYSHAAMIVNFCGVIDRYVSVWYRK